MKKGTLLLLFSVAFSSGFAQLENFKKAKPLPGDKYKLDLLNRYKLQQAPIIIAPQNGDPLPMGVLKIGLEKKLVGTNKNGDDIYVIKPYNMPCVSPPKSYKSKMSVLGFQQVTPIKPNGE